MREAKRLEGMASAMSASRRPRTDDFQRAVAVVLRWALKLRLRLDALAGRRR